MHMAAVMSLAAATKAIALAMTIVRNGKSNSNKCAVDCTAWMLCCYNRLRIALQSSALTKGAPSSRCSPLGAHVDLSSPKTQLYSAPLSSTHLHSTQSTPITHPCFMLPLNSGHYNLHDGYEALASSPFGVHMSTPL